MSCSSMITGTHLRQLSHTIVWETVAQGKHRRRRRSIACFRWQRVILNYSAADLMCHWRIAGCMHTQHCSMSKKAVFFTTCCRVFWSNFRELIHLTSKQMMSFASYCKLMTLTMTIWTSKSGRSVCLKHFTRMTWALPRSTKNESS